MTRDTTATANRTAKCACCLLNTVCLPRWLDLEQTDAFDSIVVQHRPFRRGSPLYTAGAPFRSIYVVRSGAIKRVMLSADGEEYVSRVYLRGELVGLDAIGQRAHPATAVAVETTTVCEIPFVGLETLAAEIPGLQQRLLDLMSKELLAGQTIAQAIATRRGEERVAYALIDIAQRQGRGDGTPTCFHLPIPRHDLSNHLGLAPETLSRIMKRLCAAEFISANGREITLRDVDALHRLAYREMPTR